MFRTSLLRASVGLLVLFFPSQRLSAQEQATLTVDATGVGVTAEAAEKAALVNAVQQAVGLFLDNETLVKNEQVVNDSILSLSDGFVSKFEVKVPPKARILDGLYETKITAVVKKGRIGAELEKRQLTQSVNAEASWAEAVTSVKSAQDAVEVFKKWMPLLAVGAFKAHCVDDNGHPNASIRPQIRPDPTTGQVTCGWNFVVSYDRSFFYEKAVPLLTKIFNSIAERSLPDFSLSAPGFDTIKKFKSEDHVAYKLALIGSPVRLADKFKGYFPALDRDQMIVCLNCSGDKSRQNLRFHAWVLNASVYEPLLEKMLVPYQMIIKLTDADGSVAWEGQSPFTQTLFAPDSRPPGGAYSSRQGLTGPDAVPVRTVRTPFSYRTERWAREPLCLWLNPDFYLKEVFRNRFGLVDNLVIHQEISTDPDQVRKFKNITFSFAPISTNQ